MHSETRGGVLLGIALAASAMAQACSLGYDGYQPLDHTLVSGLTKPGELTVDSTTVFWASRTTPGAVMMAPLAGGAPNTLATVPEADGYPCAIAVDSESVYWVNTFGSVMKVGVDGGDPVVLAPGQDWSCAIAIDAASVYLATYSEGSVLKVDKHGGAPVVLAMGQSRPGAIAVDSSNVYWGNSLPAAVMKVGVNGGTPIRLAAGGSHDQFDDIALGGASLYWIDGGGYLMKVDRAGGTPVTLTRPEDDPTRIAADSDAVYWIEGGPQGEVDRILSNGDRSDVRTMPQRYPWAIVVDSTTIYWTNQGDADGDGAVVSAPKYRVY